MITVTAFKWLPPFAQGLSRDMRVRWALEEAGLPYQARHISFEDKVKPDYVALQPFAQVPVLEDGKVTLFESGAIVLHIAKKSEVLLPKDEAAGARAIAWLFAALNSVEIVVQQLAEIDLFAADKEWAKLRRPEIEQALRARLDQLAAAIKGPWLDGDRFTCGDLMMATVLQILRHTDLVTSHKVLGPYVARCEARPAFQRALAAHMEVHKAA